MLRVLPLCPQTFIVWWRVGGLRWRSYLLAKCAGTGFQGHQTWGRSVLSPLFSRLTNRQFVWSHGEPPMVKSWCVSWPGGSLLAWHVASKCAEKWKSRACFEHIWSIFIFNNSQWVFMCLPLPMEAQFFTCRLLFFQFWHPTLEKWDEEQWKDQPAQYQPGGKVDFYSLGDGQWLEQFIWNLF